MYVLLNMKDCAKDITVSVVLDMCIIETHRDAPHPHV